MRGTGTGSRSLPLYFRERFLRFASEEDRLRFFRSLFIDFLFEEFLKQSLREGKI